MATLTLRDGRKLGYREYGDVEGGYPVIFSHGNMNSRLMEPMWEKTQAQTEAAGARVIAVDRPGVGLSTVHDGRSYTDYAKDVEELIGHLNLVDADAGVAVVGYSSGGPHTLSCAAHMPDVVKAVGLIASDGPYVQMGDMAMYTKYFGTEAAQATPLRITMDESIARAEANVTHQREAYQTMKKAERRETAVADIDESVVQGNYNGVAGDTVLESSAWPFELAAVTQPVVMYHGDNDTDVFPAAAEYLAAQLPSATLHMAEGESHSIIRRKWHDLLVGVITAARAGGAGGAGGAGARL